MIDDHFCKLSCFELLCAITQSEYKNEVWSWTINPSAGGSLLAIAIGCSALIECFSDGTFHVSGRSQPLKEAIKQALLFNNQLEKAELLRLVEKVSGSILKTDEPRIFGALAFDLPDAKVKESHKPYLIAIIWVPSALLVEEHESRIKYLLQDEVTGPSYQELIAIIFGLEKQISMPSRIDLAPTVSRDQYISAVNEAKSYIKNGDAYQIQIGYEYSGTTSESIFWLFKRIWKEYRSVKMFYSSVLSYEFVSASPENLVEVIGERVSMRPLAGSISKAGKNYHSKLMKSAKEQAEHVMLVDLCRNDIGRIAKTGSVKVPKFAEVIELPNILHLASVVEGRLSEASDKWSAVMSCFPAGTVVGAPKIRAFQLISELEDTERRFYGGVAFANLSKDHLDTALLIRTAIRYGTDLQIRAAAGVVSDSDPVQEYEEVENKLSKLLAFFQDMNDE